MQNPPKDHRPGDGLSLESHKYSQAAGPFWLAEAIKVLVSSNSVSSLPLHLLGESACMAFHHRVSPAVGITASGKRALWTHTQVVLRAMCRRLQCTLLMWTQQQLCWRMTTVRCHGWWQQALAVSGRLPLPMQWLHNHRTQLIAAKLGHARQLMGTNIASCCAYYHAPPLCSYARDGML